jgi:hypothetical protein
MAAWVKWLKHCAVDASLVPPRHALTPEHVAAGWLGLHQVHTVRSVAIDLLFRSDSAAPPSLVNPEAAYLKIHTLAEKYKAHKKKHSRKPHDAPAFETGQGWSWPFTPQQRCGSVAVEAIANAAALLRLSIDSTPRHLLATSGLSHVIVRRFEGRQVLLQLECSSDSWELYALNNVADAILAGTGFATVAEMKGVLAMIAGAVQCPGLAPAFLGVYGEEKHLADELHVDTHVDLGTCHHTACPHFFTASDFDTLRLPLAARLSSVPSGQDHLSAPCLKLKRAVAARKKRALESANDTNLKPTTNLKTLTKDALLAQVRQLRETNKALGAAVSKAEGIAATVWNEATAARVSRIEADTVVALNDADADELTRVAESVCSEPSSLKLLREYLAKDESGTLNALFENSFQMLINKVEGKTKLNRPSSHFLRIVFKIYLRSPAAAKDIGESGLIPMPHKRTFQRKLAPFRPTFGFTQMTTRLLFRIAERYDLLHPTAKKHGTFAFDEMSVRAGLTLNAGNELLAGLADRDDWQDLSDIYREVKTGDTPKTTKVMACMYRDLDNGFEFIGPMLESPVGLDAEAIYNYFWKCLEVLGQSLSSSLSVSTVSNSFPLLLSTRRLLHLRRCLRRGEHQPLLRQDVLPKHRRQHQPGGALVL